MKTLNFSKIVLVVITTILFFPMCKKTQPCDGVVADGNYNFKNTLDVIHERTSIREYSDEKISKDILEEIIRAGMAAPSAMNKQPWEFIIIDDKEILAQFAQRIQTSKMADKAAAAILVCGDMEKAGEGWLQQYWIQDCSAASQNILLAITELGLGGVWTSIYPAEERMQIAAEILNLPENIIPLNIIPLGYPLKEVAPKNKWNPERIRWNKYN